MCLLVTIKMKLRRLSIVSTTRFFKSYSVDYQRFESGCFIIEAKNSTEIKLLIIILSTLEPIKTMMNMQKLQKTLEAAIEGIAMIGNLLSKLLKLF